MHVGGSRIEDLGPKGGLGRLTVAGRDDLEPAAFGGGRVAHSGRFEPDAHGQ